MNKIIILLGLVFISGLVQALDCGYVPTDDCTKLSTAEDCAMYYSWSGPKACSWSGTDCSTGADCIRIPPPTINMNLENSSLNSTVAGASFVRGDFTHAFLHVFDTSWAGFWWIAVLYVGVMAHIYIRTQNIGIPVMVSLINFIGLTSLGVLPPEFSVVAYGFISMGLAGILYFAAKGDGA